MSNILLKETYLDKSDLNGIGLFAKEKINKNDIIWEYDNRTTLSWNKNEYKKLKYELLPVSFNNIERFIYLNNEIYYLNLDDSRFMNHSGNPNMSWNNNSCIALRNIEIGEELTINYKEFCDAEDLFYIEKETYLQHYKEGDLNAITKRLKPKDNI